MKDLKKHFEEAVFLNLDIHKQIVGRLDSLVRTTKDSTRHFEKTIGWKEIERSQALTIDPEDPAFAHLHMCRQSDHEGMSESFQFEWTDDGSTSVKVTFTDIHQDDDQTPTFDTEIEANNGDCASPIFVAARVLYATMEAQLLIEKSIPGCKFTENNY